MRLGGKLAFFHLFEVMDGGLAVGFVLYHDDDRIEVVSFRGFHPGLGEDDDLVPAENAGPAGR